ncbi:MAG: hypothetical protein OXB93_04620 [Cytophagales bacterium]|nr:hypothetical protein [Cytophagales bacterium]
MWVFPTGLFGQRFSFVEDLRLTGDRSFPPSLFTDRSAVVFRDFEKIDIFHKGLFEASVDAIVYLEEDELLSGSEPTRAFATWLSHRRVRNLIFISPLEGIEGMDADGEEDLWSLSLVGFSGRSSLLSSSSPYWHAKGSLSTLFSTLQHEMYESGSRTENMLIPHHPEYFGDISIPRKKVSFLFPHNMRASPLMVAAPVYAGRDLLNSPEPLSKSLEEKLQKQQKELEETLANHYPYPYKLISYTGQDEEILGEGYQHVLLHVRGNTPFLKRLFNLSVEEQNKTDDLVYLFYVKHVLSKEVYLGDQWGVSDSLSVALQKFLGQE